MMDATTLIKEITETFPHAMRSEIAAAFNLDPWSVGKVIIKNNGRRRSRVHQRARDRALVQSIKEYADKRCGGNVEIVLIKTEPPALCVNGRLVA